MQRRNITPEKKRCYAEYYDDRTIKMVADMYQDNIERFKYGFGD